MKRQLLIIMACLVLAMVHGCADAASAQVVGAAGRTTGANNSGGIYVFPLTLGTISCSGTTCTATSITVTPPSQVVSGLLVFNSSHDPNFTVGGASGGGAGQMQVSCDGGSTWMATAVGSGSTGFATSYNYPPASCTGPTNLNTLQFRLYLTGGGGTSSFNMTFTSPSSVTISW